MLLGSPPGYIVVNAQNNFSSFQYCVKVATAMFGYMTDLCTVDIVRVEEITAEGIVRL